MEIEEEEEEEEEEERRRSQWQTAEAQPPTDYSFISNFQIWFKPFIIIIVYA